MHRHRTIVLCLVGILCVLPAFAEPPIGQMVDATDDDTINSFGDSPIGFLIGIIAFSIPLVVVALGFYLHDKEQSSRRLEEAEAKRKREERIRIAQAKRDAVQAEALAEYKDHLHQLRDEPNNPDIKQATLNSGREYANICRNREGETIFDEIALMNDINAACANSGHQNIGAKAEFVNRDSISDRLSKLVSLRDEGMIDDEEYQAKRKSILGDL